MKMSQLYELFLSHPEVTTDSRRCWPGSLFFALKGDKFDGNGYASAALSKGCAYVVVDDPDVVVTGDERYILVKNVLETLQQLAQEHRKHFSYPVLQVTGTNGKTTTKELITAVLRKKYNVQATLANYNNHIGVPKTLLRLNRGNRFAVVETGANHPGEIKALSEIVDPDYGLITNVGKAHLEGFGSFEGVIRTKGELYDYLRKKDSGCIFLDGDNPYLGKISDGLKIIKYGVPGHKDYLVEGEVVNCNPYLHMHWRKVGDMNWQEVETKLIGTYNLQNVLAAVCVGTYFGVAAEYICAALKHYIPKNDRSELRTTASNRLIVDAYNANPTSMSVALSNFKAMPEEHKMVILGDMRELGSVSDEEHQKIVDFLKNAGFEKVWLVGENFKKIGSEFQCFNDVEEVKEFLKLNSLKDYLILIKGSNATHLSVLPDLL
ncbi:MAG: UDP-N-acetylmuramoyl-tripeptide--D-alanyl-D-alanine ligase [Bacteroidaceae bacterium]|jgi:UDP-N-acetylmuramoyl-tripeptide--D-alanyl-D-alanine ligase